MDYLDFKKAFYTFTLQDVYSDILKLKDGMNDKRINYILPKSYSIRITGNYLVGLLEGHFI